MAAYGKGQMLGSGINPESFKLDFGGFADAAKMQAQGLSNLGQSIGGAIQNYGEVKKEQKKVDAYNKASAKSIEAAITLGESYKIKGVKETLNPFLESYNDPNLSPIEKAALLDEGKAMIPNVFGRFDKNQAMLIEQAQNEAATNVAKARAEAAAGAAPPIEKFGTPVGELQLQWNPQTQSYERPRINLQGGNLPQATTQNQIDEALAIGLMPKGDGTEGLPPVGTPSDSTATNILLGNIGFTPNEPAEQGEIMTEEQVIELKNKGFRISGRPLGNGKVYVTKQDSLAPQRGEETIIDPATGIVTTRDIALGGKAEALAKTKRASEFEETRQTNFIIDKANEAEEIIDYSISTYGPGTLVDVAKSTVPGTQEYKLKNQILPAIKDSIALSSLKQLKAASPTGASGLGSLTDKEGKRLENMYGVLDIGGDKATLKNDIKRLKQTAFDYIHGSKKEREEALANGDITKDENDQVEKMYREQILGVTTPTTPTAPTDTPVADQLRKLENKYKNK